MNTVLMLISWITLSPLIGIWLGRMIREADVREVTVFLEGWTPAPTSRDGGHSRAPGG